MEEDYYKILGIQKNASQSDIKKAYQQLILKYHPDKNSGKDAEEMSRKVNQAYKILRDPEERRKYDNPPKFNNPFNFSGMAHMFMQQIVIINVTVVLTLEELCNDKTIKLSFTRQDKCSHCGGAGTEDKKVNKCIPCNGSGRVKLQHGNQIRNLSCDACHGSGYRPDPDNKCKTCDGKRIVNKQVDVDINMITTIIKHPRISVQGIGHYNEKTGRYGDVTVTFKIEIPPDSNFAIEEGELIYNLNLKLGDLLFGFSKILHHPAGTYMLKVPNGKIINPNKKKSIKNLGNLPLLIKFIIEYPKTVEYPESLSVNEMKELLGSVNDDEGDYPVLNL